MHWPRLFVLACFLFAFAAGAADGQCPVCGKRYTKQVYRVTRMGSDDKVLVCEDCAHLSTTCYICGVPVARNFTTCPDGRLICEEDAVRAVMDQAKAEKLFDDAKFWSQSLFSRFGALPNSNIRVLLESKTDLDNVGDRISYHPGGLLMGVTHTRKTDHGYEHVISLLHGLSQEPFLCISVHEYGHTWMHENLPAGRGINPATAEGFCEWLAYKFATERHSDQQVQVILKNTYTRGQVNAFIAAEDAYGFHRVIQWMKSGVDASLDRDAPDRIIHLKESGEAGAQAAAAPIAAAPAVAPQVRPDKLLLKGISGTASRRFALINDQTFMSGEQGKVRLGTSNVVVRCMEIRAKSVLVQRPANGMAEELFIGPVQ